MFPRHAVIVTAAGSSQRYNSTSEVRAKKEFVKLNGHSILYRSVNAFLEVPNLAAIFVTYKDGTENLTKAALENLEEKGIPLYLVKGGKTRQESVFNALKALYAENGKLKVEIVSIHDGARPFVTKDQIMDCIAYAKLFGGAAPGVSIRDTLIKVSEDGMFENAIDRTDVYQVQTPQVFKFPEIFNAHVQAVKESKFYTDDTQVFKAAGMQTAITKGNPGNIKITYAGDLEEFQK